MVQTNQSPFGRVLDLLELRPHLRAREIAVAATIVTVTVPFFLIAPRPSADLQDYWRVAILEIAGPVHVIKNADSWEFEHDAAHPGDLLTLEHRYWQSRPMVVLLGWLLAKPYRAAGLPTIAAMTPEEGKLVVGHDPYPDAYNGTSPEYAGFVTLNWMLLVVSAMLLKSLIRASSYLQPEVFLPLSMLLVNVVTKPYFWTPHVQMFSVMLGVATIVILRPLLSRVVDLRPHHAALIGLASGVAALAYGAFAVTTGSVILCILTGAGGLRNGLRHKLVLCLSLVAAFFTPLVIWAGFVTARTGTFYSPETQRYHEFVWIPELLATGLRRFVGPAALHLTRYLRLLVQVSLVSAILIAATAIFFRQALSGRGRLRHADTRHAVVLYMAANAVFYASMGFEAERLAWTIVPALLVILGLQVGLIDDALTAGKRLWFRVGVYAVAIANSAFIVLSPGPFA